MSVHGPFVVLVLYLLGERCGFLVYVLAGYIRGVLFFRVFRFSDYFASGSLSVPRGCLP